MLNTQNQALITIACVHFIVVAPVYIAALLILMFVCQVMLHLKFMLLSICLYVNVCVCVCVYLSLFSMFLWGQGCLHYKKMWLFKRSNLINVSTLTKGDACFDLRLGAWNTQVTFDSDIWLKWPFGPCDKPNIWSKRLEVHQNDQGLVKLTIFNGHCDLQLFKLAISFDT
jgi:hypothetical protein